MANPSIFAAFERMWQHVVTALSGKSDSNHTHDDRYYTEVEVDTKISNHTDNSDVHVTTTNKTQWNSAYTHSTSPHAPSTAEKNIIVGIQKNGTDLTVNSSTRKVNITVPTQASDIGADAAGTAQTKADAALASAKSYTDEKIDAIVGDGASTTLDTIGEISAAITENQGMLTTLNNAIGNKVDKVSGKGLSTNDLTATLKSNYDTAYSHVSNTNNPHEVTLSQLGVSATATELNYVDGVTSNIQTQLNGKQASITGGASTIASSNLTASRALVSNSSGKVAVSAVTSTELGYLDGVTSAIQTQLDAKAPTGHGHDNATTSVAGFMSASDKTKLNGISEGADSVSFTRSLTSGTKVGTITINGTGTDLYAPTNTDTHYTSKNVVGSTSATSNTTTALTNGNVYLNSVENSTVTSTHKISGSGATTVTTDENGNIIISSTDNNTVYTHPSSHPASMITGLATVATSGSYNDLSNKPTIPSYSQATSSALGLVKIGYTESGKNYPVELNDSGQMYVNVPWTDNNTVYTHPTYTARTGKPTTNQTPAFGGTATVSQITSDTSGHVTGATDRTITIPSTLSNGTGTAGLIKTSSTVTSSSGYTACPVISGVPYYKDTNTTYTLSSFGVTATSTELNYTDGVTSNIQTQLNNKANASDVMDLTSDQIASGVKTFTNGINIGNALLSYDSENQRLVISVS